MASDDPKLRKYFQETFPNKVIMINEKPHHLDYVKRLNRKREREELKNMFAEWYIIGKGDYLLTNNAHDFGVSAFSRSSWLYNLKSRFFMLRTDQNELCYEGEFPYTGNIALVSSVCRRHPDRCCR